MKNSYFFILGGLLLLQAVSSDFGKVSAQTLTADTLVWSWEVSTTTSTWTKTCTLEYSGNLVLDWGDGSVQTLTDSLSGKVLTHVYASVANFSCRATGTGILYFKADSRRLLTLDPKKATGLTYLSCTSNQLSSLDVSKNPELVSLYCGSNNLTSLDVAKCTSIQTLTCSDNMLTVLDLTNLPTLKKLTCHTNALASLRVSPTGSLSYVSCLNCSLQVAALDTLFAQLPHLSAVPTSRNLYVLNNPGASNCNISVATAKNWLPDKTLTSCSFYMPAMSCMVGTSVELDICLTNPVPVIAFELDVVFPDDFELDTIQSCLATARKGGHLLSIAKTNASHKQYKLMAYSMTTGDVFKGSSGVMLQLYGKSPDTAKVCVVQLKKAVLVDTTTSMCSVTVTDGTLTVMPASVNGDVNGDKLVDVTDIVNLVAYINGKNPVGFDTIAGDLDNNGLLNVADITRMVVIINAGGSILRSATADSEVLSLYDRQNAAGGNNVFLRQSALDRKVLELCLDNVDAVQALQVDVTLPEGLSLRSSEISCKTLRNNGHQVQVGQIGINRYRLLVYALKPDAMFKGDTGSLVALPLEVAETLSDGEYPVCLRASVLTGMNRATVPSTVFDLKTTIESSLSTDEEIWVGSDGKSQLSVKGMGLKEMIVWDLAGRILFHRNLTGENTYNLSLSKGVYVVQILSSLQPNYFQKVMVR